jgi:ureidoacrylate peracid hydrolase
MVADRMAHPPLRRGAEDIPLGQTLPDLPAQVQPRWRRLGVRVLAAGERFAIGRRSADGTAIIGPWDGKIWDRIRAVAEANDCVPHMLQVLNAARKAKLRVFYALHHRYRPGDYETWKYIAPAQKAAWVRKSFEYGTWGGEIRPEFEPKPGEIVATEHWCSSGFANTDLDLQLKKHGIHQLIFIGLIAHTCIEATVRFVAELGYEVTVVKDATADYSDEEMHAALDINIPNYASAIVTTNEIVDLISSVQILGISAQ